MKITKVDFCGSFCETFKDVDFYFNPITCTFDGDVEIRDYKLYIKGVHIPIRETLIGSAYNEFIMAEHSWKKHYELDFKLDYNGGYLVRHKPSGGTVSRFLDSIFSIGMPEKEWQRPCLSEKSPR